MPYNLKHEIQDKIQIANNKTDTLDKKNTIETLLKDV